MRACPGCSSLSQDGQAVKNWKPGDAAFLKVRKGYIYCTIVNVGDPNTVTVMYEGIVQPVRVMRDRLSD